jgi:bifunctional non-homologous end joining protein LigD
MPAKSNRTHKTVIKRLIAASPSRPTPRKVSPVLATLADLPFDDPEWIFEIKWDGYRAIAILNGRSAQLLSRNDKSFREKFYPVYLSLQQWKIEAVLDGEIIVMGKKGISNFGALQNWKKEADGELLYYLFDILWFEGHDLRMLPLESRKEILESLQLPAPNIRISEGIISRGKDLFRSAKKLGLEGIMAKKLDSPYREGIRSREWLKIKTHKRQEVVIGGYTLNEGSGKLFSSLLVGVYKNGKFVYTGKVGTGFNQKTQAELLKQFKPLTIKKAPFKSVPDINMPSRFRPDPPHAKAVWLKPKLVCEVNFTEITTDGLMRHPSFEGMRTDKQPKKIFLEKEIPIL